MIGIDHREQGRKERALAEYYRPWLDILPSVENRLHISCPTSNLNRFSVERLLLMS